MLSCEKVNLAKEDKNETAEENEKFVIQTQSSDIKLSEQEIEDTECGFGFIRGAWLQRLASKKSFLIIHAITGMICSASYHYYSGILTTLEKQFKFTSIQMGYVGTICKFFISILMSGYCSSIQGGFSASLFRSANLSYMRLKATIGILYPVTTMSCPMKI